MKKMAVFVEGQTEAIFIKRLLLEIAGRKNIAFSEFEVSGGRRTDRIQSLQSTEQYVNQKYIVFIYNSGADNRVVSDVRENIPSLQKQNFTKILGLLDVYPKRHEEIPMFRKGLAFGLPIDGKSVSILLSIMEIEAWFLAETNHYEKIDANLNLNLIKQNLGLDIPNEDIETRSHPSEDLKQIYKLVGKTYSKMKKHVERTVEVLDYSNIYLELNKKISALEDLINHIDEYLGN